MRCLAYYIVSGAGEDFIDLLWEEISTNSSLKFILSTLTSVVSLTENNIFSPEENVVLVKYISGFDDLLEKINNQEKLQEKLLNWFDEVDQSEVVSSESCTPYQQSLVDKYRAKGLTL